MNSLEKHNENLENQVQKSVDGIKVEFDEIVGDTQNDEESPYYFMEVAILSQSLARIELLQPFDDFNYEDTVIYDMLPPLGTLPIHLRQLTLKKAIERELDFTFNMHTFLVNSFTAILAWRLVLKCTHMRAVGDYSIPTEILFPDDAPELDIYYAIPQETLDVWIPKWKFKHLKTKNLVEFKYIE